MTSATVTAPRTTVTSDAIKIENLTVTFSSKRATVTAVQDVDLQVADGEFVSIAGPSGCGKSTLLKVVAGLTNATAGDVRLRGTRVQGPQRDIGYVFQRAALLEWRSVRRNILLQAEMRGMPRKAAQARCDYLIEMTGLTGFENALPHELSGGMQQRVSLCRALLHEPSVLLMDEPFGALDEIVRDKLNEQLLELWARTGKTICFVTHSIPEAVYLSTRIVVMSPRPGRVTDVIESPLPRERPLHIRESAEFLAIAARVRDGLRAGIGDEV